MQLSLLFEDPVVREPQRAPTAPSDEPRNRNSEPQNENPQNQNSQNRNQNPQNPKNQKNQNRNQTNQNQNPEPRTPNAEPILLFTRHPRAKRYVLRVADDGAVRVTIPRWGSRREAQEFAKSQRAWIDRQLRKVAADRERPKPPELSAAELHALIARAQYELPPRLLELAATHGLTVSRISIRNQRWRWGSCNRNGHICLNWRLVTMPEWVRDYVLIHELMHLKRMDHSRTFWRFVAAACPNYQDARRWLRRASRT